MLILFDENGHRREQNCHGRHTGQQQPMHVILRGVRLHIKHSETQTRAATIQK